MESLRSVEENISGTMRWWLTNRATVVRPNGSEYLRIDHNTVTPSRGRHILFLHLLPIFPALSSSNRDSQHKH
jgi:hypothetical protein